MKGYSLAGAAGLLWGLISLFGKLIVRYDADPCAMMAIRAALAFVTLAVALLFLQPHALRIGWQDVPFFAAFGLFGVALAYASYVFALKYTTVTTAVMISYTYPALVSILAVIFLGEKFHYLKVVALMSVLVGCFFVAEAFRPAALQLNLLGILYSTGTSLALAIYSLVAKRAVARYSPWTLALYGFGFGALWLVMIASPRSLMEVHLPAFGWGILLAWAWIPTVLAYGLYLSALKYIEASRATIIATLEPVSAIALACLFLGERISISQLLGAVLVFVGVIIAARMSTPKGTDVLESCDESEKEVHMRRRYSNVHTAG